MRKMLVYLLLLATFFFPFIFPFGGGKRRFLIAEAEKGGELGGDARHFGIVYNPDRKGDTQDIERAIKSLKELGVKWARVHISWKKVEKRGKGIYNQQKLSYYDAFINRLLQAGIKVMGFIGGMSPLWASRRAKQTLAPPPDDPKDLADFVEYLMRRYKGRIKIWQVMNEPNTPRHGVEPTYLAEIFRVVYTRAKGADPNCLIVTPGFVGVGQRRLEYLREFLKAGGGKYIDVVDFHMYGGLSVIIRDLPKLKALLNQYGVNKPIQFSETGSPSRFSPNSSPQGRKWLSSMIKQGRYEPDIDILEATTQTQAEELVKRLVIALSLGVQRIYWNRFCADQPEREIPINHKTSYGFHGSKGILDYGYKPKPAFYAFKTIIQKLDVAKFLKPLRLGGGAEGYLFETDAGMVCVLWARRGKVSLPISTISSHLTGEKKGKVKLYDLFGKEITLQDKLTLTSAPVYFEQESK